MFPKRFTDPLGSKLPALERSIIKLRGLEMLLVLFYAEELKRDVLDRIQTTDELMSRLPNTKKDFSAREPKGTKNPVDKALNALVADGAITPLEKDEIVRLIDYRNIIGHQIHNLLVNISPERITREIVMFRPDWLPKYDYNAVERLRHFHSVLDGLYKTHHYVQELNYNGLLFKSAERTLISEIKRLKRKINKLDKLRRAKIQTLNSKLSLKRTELKGDLQPQHPLNQYDDGRLTRRGVEICYRLFDMGKSTMAIAHLTGLSLTAARKRQRMWTASGGANRAKRDIAAIPKRKFYARYDD